MSKLTEKAIRESFIRLLNEQPLDKITVRQIAEDCGISRNTFYYHYHDVYDLLERLFLDEEQRLIADTRNITTLQQSFTESTRFVLENERAVYHIYNSLSHDVLTRYIYNVSEICMRSYIENKCVGLNPADSDVENLVFLYASMLEGVVVNVLREGITRDVEALVQNSIRMLDGTVRLALENSCK